MDTTDAGKHLLPGPTPTPTQVEKAREIERMSREELPLVRSAALAWRNGLAGLLAAITGFGLVKGRSDIGQLAEGYSQLAGAMLLGALIAGTVAALALLRAAHGQPAVASADSIDLALHGDHREAVASVRALHRGICLSVLCAALLAAAVGLTWYGPPRQGPQLQIVNGGTTLCGTVVATGHGAVTLEIHGQRVPTDLNSAQLIKPIDAC